MPAPDEILAIARLMREKFGPGVKLLRVVCDNGDQLGNPIWDDPLLAPLKSDPLRGSETSPTMQRMPDPAPTHNAYASMRQK